VEQRGTVILIICWIGCVLGGLALVTGYSNRPGLAAAAPPDTWPASAPSRDRLRPSLVIFLHPHCPCSQAALSELARLLPRLNESIEVRLVFVSLPGVPDAEGGALWAQAANIAGAQRVRDPGGRMARQFGARTSGQTFLFDADGRRLFSGGLTARRGHEGGNAGAAAIAAHLRCDPRAPPATPVFGCALFDGADHAAPEGGT